MKNKLLLLVVSVMVAMLMLALAVNADSIVTSTSSEYGELTIIDGDIGNTGISQLKDDGTIARTVLFDGEFYYTVPTTYVLTESPKTVNGEIKQMFLLSFGEIGKKLGKTFNKNSIIRLEFPSDIDYICENNESMKNCNNVVEIIINDGLRIWDGSQRKSFTNCHSLKSIDISGMVLEYPQSAFALFEYCYELEYVKLPDAYYNGESYVNYDTDHMFSGCYKLTKIENLNGFFQGVTSLGYKTFYNCWALPGVTLWDNLTAIEGRAFGNCRAITEMIIPDSVKIIGTNETVFEACTSLKKLVLPAQASLGNYCFEKCTGLTDVWMPTKASTFGVQVFGQCGDGLGVTFYFVTAESTITISDSQNKQDPFITALGKEGDTRIKYNTPVSTKCEVFLGAHAFIPAEGDRIVYSNGYANEGAITDICTKCTTKSVTNTPPLFVCLGYSVTTLGDGGLVMSFKINDTAISEYEAAVGKAVQYGVFAVSKNKLGSGYVFDENGTAADGVIYQNVTTYSFDMFQIKITGFITDEHKDVPLALGAYVAVSDEGNTEYSYIQDGVPEKGDKYCFTSYNEQL